MHQHLQSVQSQRFFFRPRPVDILMSTEKADEVSRKRTRLPDHNSNTFRTNTGTPYVNMSNNRDNHMSSSRRRPMGGKISLAAFAQRKGEVRALEAFKKRKSDKQKATSIALRKYRRVMKREGLEAGTGASRKRKPSSKTVDGGGEDEDEDEDERKETDCDGDDDKSDMLDDVGGRGETTEKNNTKKRQKTNPFKKSIEKAELAKKQMEQSKIDKVQNEKDRQQKLKQRREQTKLLKQRTRKGQPIMKNQVEHLLYKLEKQQKRDHHHHHQQQQQQQRDHQHPRSNGTRR